MDSRIESTVNTRYIKNNKLRIKVTNRCNMNCWFCHAEGSPGSEDVVLNAALYDAIDTFKSVFQYAHITGGEPFQYPHLFELIELLSSHTYKLAITSNGLFVFNDYTLRILERIEYINISFHSLQSDYYSSLAHSNAGSSIVDQIANNIQNLISILPVRINTVVTGDGELQHLNDMIHFAANIGCELKFVPELRTKELSIKAIEQILSVNGYKLYEKIRISPSSNLRERYINQAGHIIEVKKLSPCFPDILCGGCDLVNQCNEGFSFLRLGGNPLYCQTCIKKSPIPYTEFIRAQWKQYKEEFDNASFYCE
mgnify:CR=1 FL=1